MTGYLNEMANEIHNVDNIRWRTDLETGEVRKEARHPGVLLMLIVTELAEAYEGIRKNLMDEKLPHRTAEEVEIADTFIRLFDYAGARGLDLDGAIAEKRAYNAIREDHTLEHRKGTHGKKF